jgi:hypothetical protein
LRPPAENGDTTTTVREGYLGCAPTIEAMGMMAEPNKVHSKLRRVLVVVTFFMNNSDYYFNIEGLYNLLQHHKHLDQLSPYVFERQRLTALQICLEVLGNSSEFVINYQTLLLKE